MLDTLNVYRAVYQLYLNKLKERAQEKGEKWKLPNARTLTTAQGSGWSEDTRCRCRGHAG